MKSQSITEIFYNGEIYEIALIDGPNIDDVLIAEAQVQARMISTGEKDASRRVDRAMRDYLVRLGVER
jgi:hypothetical protein